MTTDEVAWLAGVVEGEGHIGRTKQPRPGGGYYRRPMIVIRMTDRDVVERVSQMFGGMAVVPIKAQRDGWLPQFQTAVTGKRAEALLAQISPWLGRRRAAKVAEVLSAPTVELPAGTLDAS